MKKEEKEEEEDTTPPILTVPEGIVIEPTSFAEGAQVRYTVKAQDNVDSTEEDPLMMICLSLTPHRQLTGLLIEFKS